MECAPGVHISVHRAKQRLAWLQPEINHSPPSAHSMFEYCYNAHKKEQPFLFRLIYLSCIIIVAHVRVFCD